jgi:hypothetical protein
MTRTDSEERVLLRQSSTIGETMGDLFSGIDAAPFQHLRPRSTVARVRDRTVTVAVVSSLAMNTFIAVAALAGPISRSFVRAEIRTQSQNSVDQAARAENGTNNVDVVAVDTGRVRSLRSLK